MILWVLKLQTVERDLGALGAHHLHKQIGNEFLYSDEFTEKPFPKLSRPNTPSSTKITLLWQVREDAGPLRSTSGKSHL